MLDVAIVPPHLTVLSMRMAVALYVTGISTPEVHPRISTTSRDVNGCICIVLGGDRETSPEAAEAEDSLDVAVVCSRLLDGVRLSCPLVCLAIPELQGAESCHSSPNVKATLPHDGLTAEELVASVRAAAAGLQVESPSLSRLNGDVMDPRRIDVLKLLAGGADTRTIARSLQLSERTVKTLVHDIQLTLGVSTRAQAVAEGIRLGLL
jgi:DNA-binding CsgD family transcriptional regulator